MGAAFRVGEYAECCCLCAHSLLTRFQTNKLYNPAAQQDKAVTMPEKVKHSAYQIRLLLTFQFLTIAKPSFARLALLKQKHQPPHAEAAEKGDGH